MNGSLITFVELRRREEIDICGGYMEFLCNENIWRGMITGILYWKNRSPRQIDWINMGTWENNSSRWVEENCERFVLFPYGAIEFFSGPFQSEIGEIIFMTNARHYVTIFPKGCTVPDQPRSEYEYRLLRSNITFI